MRPVHLALAALLLLALIAGLWAFIESGSSDVRAAARGSGRGGGSADAIDVSPGAGAGGGAGGGAAEQGRSALAASEADPGPTEVSAASRKPRVLGRVVGPDGRGIPGARVLAANGDNWIRIPLDIEAEGLPQGWIDVKRAEADAEGRFAFDSLRPGSLRLAVRAPGFAPRYEEDLLVQDRPEQTLPDVRLEPGVVLQGRVVERDGRGIAGATILQALDGLGGGAARWTMIPGRGVELGTSAADGSFRVDEIAPGPWRLIVDSPAHLVSEEEGRTERAGEQRSGLLFRLEPGAEIAGKVRAGTGALPASLRVSARPSQEREGGPQPRSEDAFASAGPAGRAGIEGRARHGLVGDEGAFLVRGLKPMVRYRLVAWTKAEVPGGWKRAPGIDAVLAFAGERGVELHLSPESALVFRLVDARTGAVVERASVWAGIGRERNLRDDKGGPRLDHPGGRVRFGEMRQQPGKLAQLRVQAPGYKDLERKSIALAPGVELDLGDLSLEPERSVIARVVDAATGAPVEGARVVMGEQTDEDLGGYFDSPPDEDHFDAPGVRYGRTGKDGRASLTSLPGKSVGIRAGAKGYRPSAVVRRLLPGDADVEVELALRRGGTVVARVLDPEGRPVPGAGIGHREPKSGPDEEGWVYGGAEQKTDERGESRFEALAPGVHAFRMRDREGGQDWYESGSEEAGVGWVETVVAEGSTATLDFAAPARGSLSGRVREGGRPLEGARLRLVEAREGTDVMDQVDWSGPDDPLSTATDHEGRYRYASLGCGRYELYVSHATRRMSARFDVVVTPDGRAFDAELDVAGVEGRATDPDGNPLPGIEILPVPAREGVVDEAPWSAVLAEDDRGGVRVSYEQGSRRSEKTDANGRYLLRGLPSGLPLIVQADGEYVQHASSAEFTLGPDEARRGVDFVLRAAGRIEIQIAGASGGGRIEPGFERRWFMVQAFRIEEGKESPAGSQWLGAWNRSAVMSSLAPGRYRLVCGPQGQDGGSQSQEEQTVEVEAGKTVSAKFKGR